MREDNQRLIDEALAQEPIRNTFRLSWEFLILNKQFTLTAMSMLLLLNILSQFIGLLAMVLSGILSLCVQIYLSRFIYETKSIQTFIAQTKESKFENVVAKNFYISMGAYLGNVVLLIGFIFLLTVLLKSNGFDLEHFDESQLLPMVQVIAIPLLVTLLLVSYIHPLVQSNVALSNSFNEAFFAVFSLFSISLWRRAFHGGYFKYISLIILVISGVALSLEMLFQVPVLNIIANFLLIVLMYVYIVVLSITAMMARRVVETQS